MSRLVQAFLLMTMMVCLAPAQLPRSVLVKVNFPGVEGRYTVKLNVFTKPSGGVSKLTLTEEEETDESSVEVSFKLSKDTAAEMVRLLKEDADAIYVEASIG